MKKEFKLALLVISIILFISFILPWAETSGIVTMFTGGDVSVSGFKLVSFANNLNKLASQYGESIWQLNLVYFYLLIPLLAVLNIVLFFLNKEKFLKITSLVHSILTIILCIIPIILLNSDNNTQLVSKAIMDAGFGYYLTFIAAVIGVFLTIITFVKPQTSESSEENNVQIDKLKNATLKALGTSKEELSNKPILHIGYLVFAIIMFIAMIFQIVNNNWYNVFEGILIIGIAVLLYLKMPSKINPEVNQTFEKTLQQINRLFQSFKISDKFISLIGNLVYLFIGILLVNIFLPYGYMLSNILNTLAILSKYGLFVSVLILLASKEFKLSHHGIFGYFIITFVMLSNSAFFNNYKYISFSTSLKVLLYWSLSWYLLYYFNGLSTKVSQKTPKNLDTTSISKEETIQEKSENIETIEETNN